MSRARRNSRRHGTLAASFALALLALSSCGTIFFAERQGQRSGRVDPNILLLDGIGLLFFIVPGLIAFGVDLATGALYLPPGVERGEGPFFHDEPAKPAAPAPEPEPAPETTSEEASAS